MEFALKKRQKTAKKSIKCIIYIKCNDPTHGLGNLIYMYLMYIMYLFIISLISKAFTDRMALQIICI